MQQFVVPQFIEVEDKIIGPVTVRQFLILLGASLFVFLAYRFGDFAMFISVLAIVGGGALIFAFVKVNGQDFHYFVLNTIQYFRRPSLRIWHKSYEREELEYLRKLGIEEQKEIITKKAPARREHIRDLSLIVNTGGYYHGQD